MIIFRLCPLILACVLTTASAQDDFSGSTRSTLTYQKYNVRPVTGPLKQHAENPRYFADASGKPIYLVGSHTWSNFQDYRMEGDAAFDYDHYIAFMVDNHFNFMRFWTWEHAAWTSWSPEKTVIDPMPYRRTGPGLALDGQPKFDLEQFNPAYFDRMRARILKASNKGIYASIMLFQAFSGVWPKGGETFKYNAFAGHYYNRDNNIQKLDGDKNKDKILDINDPKVREYQAAYIKKIIDTVWDLDNVLYEVINEGGNVEWDAFVVKTIKDYEKAKGKIHPVGLTGHGNETLQQMMASDADWVSPGTWDDESMKNVRTNPPVWKGEKVSVLDTDHIWGHGIDYRWVWKTFLRGHNVLFMDPWDPLPVWFNPEVNRPDHPNYILGRNAMKRTAEWANRINLVTMRPNADFGAVSFCIGDPGKEYLIYVEGPDAELDLTNIPGNFVVEWVHLTEGATVTDRTTAGGKKQIFRNPFTGEAILYLKLTTEVK